MEQLSIGEAEATKSKIRKAAKGGPGQTAIDLTLPGNAFSVWFENGGQGFLCKGTGDCPDAAWRLIGHYHLGDAVIFEVSEGRHRIKVLRCAEG